MGIEYSLKMYLLKLQNPEFCKLHFHRLLNMQPVLISLN